MAEQKRRSWSPRLRHAALLLLAAVAGVVVAAVGLPSWRGAASEQDPGNANPKPIDTFTQLAWTSANAVDGVSDPAASSTQPTPGTSVPR